MQITTNTSLQVHPVRFKVVDYEDASMQVKDIYDDTKKNITAAFCAQLV